MCELSADGARVAKMVKWHCLVGEVAEWHSPPVISSRVFGQRIEFLSSKVQILTAFCIALPLSDMI
jgi:hypothetical protein